MGLLYGNQSFGYVQSVGLAQRWGPDESQTDQLYTIKVVTVRAVLSAGLDPAIEDETPAETVARVSHLLTKPRQALRYDVGGKTIIDVDGIDDANGPVVTQCDITPMGTASFLIQWAAEVRLTDCGEDGGETSWLSNRWETTITYPEPYHLATRRTVGTLVLSSRDPKGPDAYRELVAPEIPDGWERARSTYTLDRSGLRVRYEFEDKELGEMPPSPLIRLDGEMGEIITNFGGKRRACINLVGTADRKQDAGEVFRVLVCVAMERVYQSGPQLAQNGTVLLTGEVKERLSTRDGVMVSLRLDWMLKPQPGRVKPQVVNPAVGRLGPAGPAGMAEIRQRRGIPAPKVQPDQNGRDENAIAVAVEWLGAALWRADDDGRGAVTPSTFGTAGTGIGLLAAALRDPCGQGTVLHEAGDGEDVFVGIDPATGAEVTVEIGDLNVESDDDGALYETPDGDSAGVYIHYEVAAYATFDSGRIMLPATGAGDEPDVSKVVTVSGKTTRIKLEWSAERGGGPCEYPDPESFFDDPNIVFLTGTLGQPGLDGMASGAAVKHGSSGVYYYGVVDPHKLKLVAPIPPYLSSSALAGDSGQSLSLAVRDIYGPSLYDGGSSSSSEPTGNPFLGGGGATGANLPPVGA
jgi:hypothetical protein